VSKTDKDAGSAGGQEPVVEGGSPAHDEELERLKERLRQQDEKLEETSRLLSSIRGADTATPNVSVRGGGTGTPGPATSPSSTAGPSSSPPNLTRQFATIGVLAVVALAAGYYSHRWMAGRADRIQPIAQATAQPEASAAPQPSLEAQAESTPAASPSAAPMNAPWAAPTAPAQAENTPAASAPTAEATAAASEPSAEAQPTMEAKAEPPSVPAVAPGQGPEPAAAPSAEAAPSPEAAPARQQSVMDSGMSRTLTDYLHHQRLPFVAATVYAQGGSPRSILLSGQVRTQKGKDDAETKSRAFLGVRGLAVHNRVRINPALGLSPSNPGYADAGAGPPAGGNSCSEVCQSNEGQCEGNCRNQNAGNSGGLGGALSSLLGQVNQGGQCAQNCRQMMNQCMGSCGAGGSGSRY